jgi:hypothetical protein
MKKYIVTIPYACFVTVEVEANNEREAEEMAIDEGYITSYAGNGGFDKLIGVYGSNVSIEAGDEPIAGIDDFNVEIEEK